jgi:hypothetical protein
MVVIGKDLLVLEFRDDKISEKENSTAHGANTR